MCEIKYDTIGCKRWRPLIMNLLILLINLCTIQESTHDVDIKYHEYEVSKFSDI